MWLLLDFSGSRVFYLPAKRGQAIVAKDRYDFVGAIIDLYFSCFVLLVFLEIPGRHQG